MINYILLWFPMLVIAILNGLLRELAFKRYVSNLTAHQLSTITLLIFFAFYIRFVIHRFPPGSSRMALLIGVIWMILTLAFEFGFGLYRGNSWAKMLEDYHLLEGRIWILVPLFVGIAPYVFHKILYR